MVFTPLRIIPAPECGVGGKSAPAGAATEADCTRKGWNEEEDPAQPGCGPPRRAWREVTTTPLAGAGLRHRAQARCLHASGAATSRVSDRYAGRCRDGA